MSIAARLFAPRAQSITSSRELERLLISHFGVAAASGASVNTDSAMRVAAVYTCLLILAQSVGQLPCQLMVADGSNRNKATDHRLYALLHDQPNEWMTAYEFWSMNMLHLASRGNGYNYKVMVRDEVRELIPFHPDSVLKVEQDEQYRLYYTVRKKDGTEVVIPQKYIMHLRGLVSNGYMGMNPIEAMRESIGTAITMDRMAGKTYANSARPSGVLEHPQKLSDPAAKRLRDSFDENYASAENAGKTLVLEEGMKWTSVSMSMADAQFLENRKFSRSEIGGIFRIPAHLMNDLEKATFSNVEHLDIGFVKHTLNPWLVNIEQAVKRDLLTPDEKKTHYLKFNVNGLLRGDFKSRMEGYARGINFGIFLRNECREWEDLNPYDGGDEPIYQSNMEPEGGRNADRQ
ncbi:MAG: phage portal protein [Desulfobulbaceae bacterium]|nr:phage portal protein [Desulfobulbaceae bacterium]